MKSLRKVCNRSNFLPFAIDKDVDYSEGSFLFPTLNRLLDICRGALISPKLLYLKDFEQALERKTRITLANEYGDRQPSDSDSERSVDDTEDELDDPVVVTSDEFQASMERIRTTAVIGVRNDDNRVSYPLLFAATLEHEDILMACARILDECVDASLLREVTSYLENVEAKISQ